MYFQNKTAVQLFFVYVELASCSLAHEPVLNARWPPAVHYYVCCLRFRVMCFYSSLDLTMSIGKDLFELIYFIKWISECCVLASQWFMLVSGVIYRSQVEDLASTYWSRNHRLVRLAKALKDLRVSVVVNLEWFPLVVDQGLEAYFRIPLDRQERESEWRQAWETFDR